MSAEQNTSSYDQTPECNHVRMHRPHRHINTHTHSLSGHRRGSDQEEITPRNKSNTQVSAEEVKIRVNSIYSSGSHKHWHTPYHREHLSHVEQSQRHTSNKYGNMLIIDAQKNTPTSQCTINTHTHTQTQHRWFLRGEEVRVLCYQRSSWVVVQDHWTQELTYCILSALDKHSITLISYFTIRGPCTHLTHDPVLYYSQRQGLHRDE